MEFIKNLPYEVKVAMSVVASALVVLASNGDLLTIILTKPLVESLPVVLPKLSAMGAFGGSLFHMQSNGNSKLPAPPPSSNPPAV